MGACIEPGSHDHHLGRSVTDGMLQPLVYKARPHQHQPGEAKDIGIVNSILKIPVESLADGMLSYQS